jgi:hypothetical protein
MTQPDSASRALAGDGRTRQAGSRGCAAEFSPVLLARHCLRVRVPSLVGSGRPERRARRRAPALPASLRLPSGTAQKGLSAAP